MQIHLLACCPDTVLSKGREELVIASPLIANRWLNYKLLFCTQSHPNASISTSHRRALTKAEQLSMALPVLFDS